MEELTLLCSKELGKNLDEARGDILKAIEPTEFACGISYAQPGFDLAAGDDGDLTQLHTECHPAWSQGSFPSTSRR